MLYKPFSSKNSSTIVTKSPFSSIWPFISFTRVTIDFLSLFSNRYRSSASSCQMSPSIRRTVVRIRWPRNVRCKYTGSMWFLVLATKYLRSGFGCGGFQPEGYSTLTSGVGTTRGANSLSTYFHSGAFLMTSTSGNWAISPTGSDERKEPLRIGFEQSAWWTRIVTKNPTYWKEKLTGTLKTILDGRNLLKPTEFWQILPIKIERANILKQWQRCYHITMFFYLTDWATVWPVMQLVKAYVTLLKIS